MSEEFLDEQIVRARKEKVKGSTQNIFGDGVSVNSENLIFREVALFDGKISIMLPDTYSKMETSTAKLKYPSEQRPQIIRTNQDGSVNFCFNLYEIPLESVQLENAITGFRSILQKIYPWSTCSDLSIEGIDNRRLGSFSFNSYAVDEQIYNIMFVTPICGKICNGIFNCPLQFLQDWDPIMKQVLESIEESKKEVE